jgi:hypothetical protein
MTKSLLGIWVVGVAIIAATQIGWFVFLRTQSFSQFAYVFLWASSGIAAVVVSFLAPRRKVTMGLSLLVPAAAFITALNYAYQLLGHGSDFPRMRGALLLFAMALLWNAITCGIGTAIGSYLSRPRNS